MIPPELSRLRAEFDAVDDEIVALLARRARLSRAAAALKRAHGLPIVDEEREAATRSERHARARALDLDLDLVDAVFDVIVAWSRAMQGAGTSSRPPDDPGATG